MGPNKGFYKQGQQQEGLRINERIKSLQVRLIGDGGEQVGVISKQEALEKASEAGLDLVEVSPDANPPVCRLIDYGKCKYQQSKKQQEAKKKQITIEVKEINLTPNTDKHDIETKQNHIKKWMSQRNRVKVGVKFRGREMAHTELGYTVLDSLMAGIDDIAAQEAPPKMEGRRLVVNLVQKSEKEKQTSTKKPSPKV